MGGRCKFFAVSLKTVRDVLPGTTASVCHPLVNGVIDEGPRGGGDGGGGGGGGVALAAALPYHVLAAFLEMLKPVRG